MMCRVSGMNCDYPDRPLSMETPMHYHRLTCALIATLGLAACSEPPTVPGADLDPATTPTFDISDGAHGGNPSFYFLPPLPPAPGSSGTSDPTHHHAVQVCELSGTTCGATVARFSNDPVRVDLTAQAYSVKWKFIGAGL